MSINNKVFGTGTIKTVLPAQGGTAASGKVWRSQKVVIEVIDNNHQSFFAVEAKDALVDFTNSLQIGMQVDFTGYVRSREWEGRWFTEIALYNIQPASQTVAHYANQQYAARQAAAQAMYPQQAQIFPQHQQQYQAPAPTPAPAPQYQAPQPQMFAPPIVKEAQAQPNPDDLPF